MKTAFSTKRFNFLNPLLQICLFASLLGLVTVKAHSVDLSFLDEPETTNKTTAPVLHTPKHDFQLALNAYNSGNHIKAFKMFQVLARYGHPNAQFNLGSMYYNGNGIEKSYDQAAHWYEQSAQHGHVEAQHNLGVLYYDGKGVARNFRRAHKWFLKAALGGNAESQYNLAVMYYSAQGVKRNLQVAFAWFKRAAQQGSANAQHNLGAMYFNGLGVKRNLIQAFRWHTRAARNGHTQSIRWLAVHLGRKTR